MSVIIFLNLHFSITNRNRRFSPVIFQLAISNENSSNEIIQCIKLLVIIISILFFNVFHLYTFLKFNFIEV